MDEERYPYEVQPARVGLARSVKDEAVHNAVRYYEMRRHLLDEEPSTALMMWVFDLDEMGVLRDALADATDARLITIHHQILAALDSVAAAE